MNFCRLHAVFGGVLKNRTILGGPILKHIQKENHDFSLEPDFARAPAAHVATPELQKNDLGTPKAGCQSTTLLVPRCRNAYNSGPPQKQNASPNQINIVIWPFPFKITKLIWFPAVFCRAQIFPKHLKRVSPRQTPQTGICAHLKVLANSQLFGAPPRPRTHARVAQSRAPA